MGTNDMFAVGHLIETTLRELVEKGDYTEVYDRIRESQYPFGGGLSPDVWRGVVTAPLKVLDTIMHIVERRTRGEFTMDEQAVAVFVEHDRLDALDIIWARTNQNWQVWQTIMDVALREGKLPWVNRLMKEVCAWMFTDAVAEVWASQYSGNVAQDACIRAIATYYLGRSLKPNEPTPFDKRLTWAHANRKNTHALAEHLIATTAPTEKQLKEFYAEAIRCFGLGEFRFGGHRTEDAWTKESIAQRLDLLLTHQPQLLRRQNIRTLVTLLALGDDPLDTSLFWAKQLPGKQLVLGEMIQLDLVRRGILFEWETRMPPALRPTIRRDRICSIVEDCGFWLDHCVISGPIRLDMYSRLAELILRLPPDDAHFQRALAPGGVLYEERIAVIGQLGQADAPINQLDSTRRLALLTQLSGGDLFAL